MWTSWTLKLFVPLASAAVLAGCTQEVSDSRKQDRTAIDHATNKQKQNLRLALTGCLSAGTGTNQFILEHVKPVPLPEQPSDALSAANLTIPENTAIRLAMGDEDELSRLTGETVTVTGILKHDGRDTIGTSGRPVSPNQPESRTDQSQAAATGQHHSEKVAKEAGPIGQQSMNNSTFPEMVVTDVKSSGKRCQ